MKCKYIIRKRQIGDVLWIEPIIKKFAEKYQKVIVYTKYNVLFENYPLPNVIFKNKLNIFEKIAGLIEKFIGSSFFFLNLDMSYEKKPRMHILHAYQQKAGLAISNDYPKLYLSEKEKQHSFNLKKKYVIIHVESFADKNYRKVFGVNWNNICTYLSAKGFEIVQIGKNPENIIGTKFIKTDLRELIVLIYKCSLFIGIDSGPSHIAASFSKPALVFFGAVEPRFRHFKDQFNGYFLQQPCEFNGCYHEVISTSGQTCRLVGDNGIPKCSLHSDEYLLKHINLILTKTDYDSKISQ